MEIQGKLIEIYEPITGEGRNGQWKRQDFVLETVSQFPRKICFSTTGDKVDVSGLQKGQEITVSINIESREYNGRWFTDVRAWRITQGISQTQTNVEIQGKLIQAFDMRSGMGKNGKEWKMQEFLLETNEQFPRKIVFAVWGDKDKSALVVGEDVTIYADIDSRLGSNGTNWFTSVQAYKAVKGLVSSQPSAMPSNDEYGIAAPAASAAPISDPIQTLTEQDLAQTDPADALPF